MSTCLTTLVKPYDLTLLVWEGNHCQNESKSTRIEVDYRVIGIILRSISVGMLSHFTCDTDVVVHGFFLQDNKRLKTFNCFSSFKLQTLVVKKK